MMFTVLFLAVPVAFGKTGSQIRVVATTRVLSSLISDIAGDLIDIYTIAPPKRDVHFVQPTPKDVLMTKKADVFIMTGGELEIWAGPLLDAAGNLALKENKKRVFDVSRGIEFLEIPTVLTRAEGDIHAFGNPHYWTDPRNVRIMIDNMAEQFGELYPEHAQMFRQNAGKLKTRLDEKMKLWEKRLMPWRGAGIVTYHKSWSYFAEWFGFNVIAEIEPKPGIPPGSKYLGELMKQIKENNVRVIIREPFQDRSAPSRIAQETGGEVLTLGQFPGAVSEAADYIGMMDHNVEMLAKAFETLGQQNNKRMK